MADEAYVFVILSPEDGVAASVSNPFAMIQEDEGTTFVQPAGNMSFPPPAVERDVVETAADNFARITLKIRSALNGVGLTAAVASALAEKGIACNVIAAFHHDHLFVPWDRRDEALQTLKDLSEHARRKV